MLKSRQLKRMVRWIAIAFLILNAIAFIGAYALTHYSAPGQLGFPRPSSSNLPSDLGMNYGTQRISMSQTEWLETWSIPARGSSQGTVVLFPGNGGSKAKQLLAPAKVIHDLGYDAVLVDFRGVGGSSGNTTTLGIREATDVALVVQQVKQLHPNRPIVLYGVSMGSAAILRSIAQKQVTPDAIILELPYARLVDAVKSRLRIVKLPTFPLAELMVFWGGIQHGFNGFTHNPITYAKQVKCPTLLFQGKQDKWTSMSEINQLLQNLKGDKQLVVFPNAGHQLLVTVDKTLWAESVDRFLRSVR